MGQRMARIVGINGLGDTLPHQILGPNAGRVLVLLGTPGTGTVQYSFGSDGTGVQSIAIQVGTAAVEMTLEKYGPAITGPLWAMLTSAGTTISVVEVSESPG